MAQFLIDASLPRPTGNTIRRFGHDATDVRDIGLGTAVDPDIAARAKAAKECLITADLDFGNILDYPPADYSGIVVIQPPPGAIRAVVLRLVEEFLRQTDLLDKLAGRLVIVEPGRIRVRPPL